MTPQEAINKLYETVTGDLEWKIVLSKALEKQIPIRVIEYKKGGYSCRFCKSVIYPKSPYCIQCGQALGWSDTE